mmetsp:Transcript_43604/g.139086  ORF Transcript_43604/g.139086 Transcript_43604/m.139086 type:complete len:521 (+) Transcript_43604:1635-3197(+)
MGLYELAALGTSDREGAGHDLVPARHPVVSKFIHGGNDEGRGLPARKRAERRPRGGGARGEGPRREHLQQARPPGNGRGVLAELARGNDEGAVELGHRHAHIGGILRLAGGRRPGGGLGGRLLDGAWGLGRARGLLGDGRFGLGGRGAPGGPPPDGLGPSGVRGRGDHAWTGESAHAHRERVRSAGRDHAVEDGRIIAPRELGEGDGLRAGGDHLELVALPPRSSVAVDVARFHVHESLAARGELEPRGALLRPGDGGDAACRGHGARAHLHVHGEAGDGGPGDGIDHGEGVGARHARLVRHLDDPALEVGHVDGHGSRALPPRDEGHLADAREDHVPEGVHTLDADEAGLPRDDALLGLKDAAVAGGGAAGEAVAAQGEDVRAAHHLGVRSELPHAGDTVRHRESAVAVVGHFGVDVHPLGLVGGSARDRALDLEAPARQVVARGVGGLHHEPRGLPRRADQFVAGAGGDLHRLPGGHGEGGWHPDELAVHVHRKRAEARLLHSDMAVVGAIPLVGNRN